MKPLQIAANFESPEVLAKLLHYVQALCEKYKDSSIRDKIKGLLHASSTVKKSRKSLMSTVMGNSRFYASHSLFLQIEKYIHNNSSVASQKCALEHLGSGVVSKEVIKSIKVIY